MREGALETIRGRLLDSSAETVHAIVDVANASVPPEVGPDWSSE